MNEIKRLHKNIKTLIECETLDHEFKVFAEEHKDVTSIEELNEIIEDEISCYQENI